MDMDRKGGGENEGGVMRSQIGNLVWLQKTGEVL